MMGFGLLLMIAFWAGLILLGVWLVRALFPHVSQPPPGSPRPLSAREVLAMRLARGEIGIEEYEVVRQALADGTEGLEATAE